MNVTEIPTNAIASTNESTSQLGNLILSQRNKRNLTIRTRAIQYLKKLDKIHFQFMEIMKLEKETFQFASNNDHRLTINFRESNLKGDSFENGTFDGVQRPVSIWFYSINITYIPNSSFKLILDDKQSDVSFNRNSFIDCEDCRNLWLIKDGKEKQIKNIFCRENTAKKLLDSDIQYKLITKCKQFQFKINLSN